MCKYSETKFEFSDSMINFGRHKILECAKEILEKSQNVTLDKDSFIRISDDLEVMLSEVRGRKGGREKGVEREGGREVEGGGGGKEGGREKGGGREGFIPLFSRSRNALRRNQSSCRDWSRSCSSL